MAPAQQKSACVLVWTRVSRGICMLSVLALSQAPGSLIDLSLPCLGRASWNAAAVVCAVRWAGRLGRTGEVLARRGMSRKGMMGRGWEWCARESAEGSSVPGVNSGHDGKCFCRMCVTGLGGKKTCMRVQPNMLSANSYISHFHCGNRSTDKVSREEAS